MSIKKIIILILVIAGFSVSAFCQKSNPKDTLNFKVYGNCEMCKVNIETALDVKGVVSANWNIETKIIRVVYNKNKTSEDQIHKKIAAAGYDTEKESTKDEVYNELHPCCKYERKSKSHE